ncbi:MAG: hypothetical protein BWZ10_00100 [candidate division BRC1 bacterium ADurb.BinA364]|nr:MAG: hypothetical protein BWZ10_00100 [candidate division BRC1 bacterium ADurb.BinA364]
MPAFYFLAARTRNALGPWPLGAKTNSLWTIALGAACMAWLAAILIEAALRQGRPRFDATWPNRIMAGLAAALCLWFHYGTMFAFAEAPAQGFWDDPSNRLGMWYYGFIHPQSCFLGATLVFGLAFAETLRARPAPPERRRWRAAWILAGPAMALLFAPFWLGIPRQTHGQAMALLRERRADILEAAALFELDPALLGGIIYVAHTRDHPRWLGAGGERLALAIWEMERQGGIVSETGQFLIDRPAGLCQMRPTTAAKSILLMSALIDRGDRERNALPSLFSPPSFLRGMSGNMLTGQLWQSMMDRELGEAFARRIRQAFEAAGAKYDLNWWDIDIAGFLLSAKPSLALAGFMLDALREHWRAEGFPIDGRPEILATLYNLGYERSRPHGAPRPNDFGRQVKAFVDSPSCRQWLEERE